MLGNFTFPKEFHLIWLNFGDNRSWLNDKELTTKTPLTAFIIIIKTTSHSLFFFIHHISWTYFRSNHDGQTE